MRIRSLRRPLITAGLLGLSLAGAWIVRSESPPTESELAITVRPAEFQVTVTTTGELQAPKFVAITAPAGLQQAQLYEGIKILSLAPEGTVVRKGDVVAELDRAPLAQKLADVTLALQKAQAVYEQAELDSSLNLSKERDNLESLRSTLEEKTLAEQQVAYEAPAIKRQAAIDLERAKRALEQAENGYRTKIKQAEAKMREVGAELQQVRNRLTAVQAIGEEFIIRAPEAGMVTYVREWNGNRKGVGAEVSAWNPIVATLPDMRVMESITYVNEIDVRKIAAGQGAVVRLDADPRKVLRGRVTSVANAGEQRPNSGGKVFELRIAVETKDTTLRPGMTTSNTVEVREVPNALTVPLEALGSEKGVPFVYKREKGSGGVVKHEVVTDAINDDAVVIVRGVAAGDRVLLSPPKDAERLPLIRLPPASDKSSTPSRATG